MASPTATKHEDQNKKQDEQDKIDTVTFLPTPYIA